MTSLVILFIHFYQKTISPDHSSYGMGWGRCRFYPSCSEYALSSFRQYGLWRGFMFSFWRILRCHPFSRGGYDPVPKSKYQIKPKG